MRKQGTYRAGEFVRTRFSPTADDAGTIMP
jgi:hypothetical protein